VRYECQVLKKMTLTQFKGFRKFDVNFGDGALLLGPNNAGKSTIISAIKICNSAAKLAMRVGAKDVFHDDGRSIRGWSISSIPEDGFVADNIRHEFEDKESRLELEYSSGAKIRLVWPTDGLAFFWVSSPDGDVTTAARAKLVLEKVGLVPTLTPLDSEEKALTKDHLAKHVESKLSSRHFRNSLRLIEVTDAAEYRSLTDFILENTPEVAELVIEQVWRENPMIDLYFRDADSHVRKEIFWAGDGLQIWLQILYHVWRNRSSLCIVLDEPDVFLHPDLQRRLVRVLEASGLQIVMSSHASEVASESEQSNLTWIERRLKRARRIGTDTQMAELSGGLGSSFNLSIARALKARVALFVEGQDMKILRTLAKRLSAVNFASERRIAVTPIGGYSHWPSVESFGWLKRQFLGDDVHVAVLLDRDFRSLADVISLEERMAASAVSAHVWRRKELESYLLVPTALARVSGVPEEVMLEILNESTTRLQGHARAQVNKVAIEVRESGVRVEEAIQTSNELFDASWATLDGQLACVPAKDVLGDVNSRVLREGGHTFSARKLAENIRLDEIDPEMANFLLTLESHLE
jgi:energy-coupling factor transporter ATP-binding protein EcfA2